MILSLKSTAVCYCSSLKYVCCCCRLRMSESKAIKVLRNHLANFPLTKWDQLHLQDPQASVIFVASPGHLFNALNPHSSNSFPVMSSLPQLSVSTLNTETSRLSCMQQCPSHPSLLEHKYLQFFYLVSHVS